MRCRPRIPLFLMKKEDSLCYLTARRFDVFASHKDSGEDFLFHADVSEALLRRMMKEVFYMLESSTRSTQRIVILALMVAANVVLSRFLSISLWNLKIGFAFLPVVLTAILYGPVAGGLVGALGDFVGATLFPIAAYFPGFTVTAFLVGAIYGIFLHKKQDLKGILLAVLLTELIGSLLLNSFWISLMFGAPFVSLLAPRAMQACGMGVVEFLTIRLISRYLPMLRQ